jgi:threonine dehydratase
MSPEDVRREVALAEERIRPWIIETPLVSSSERLHFKLENRQHTGSFKARGAFSKLLGVRDSGLGTRIIAASTGNHGAAVAYAAEKLGMQARIVVPRGANPKKLAAIRAHGASLEEHGTDGVESEHFARAESERLAITYVSPYNDPEVVGGQGTVGVELARQIAQADSVFIALGGGGLLAGVAAHLKSRWPRVRIIGCSPENSAVMIESLRAGRVLDLESRPTLSDGTAGGVESDTITFSLCRALADELCTVSEPEILDAMRRVRDELGILVEGAAGVAYAGYLRARDRAGTAVVVLCGGNVDPRVFSGE